MAEVRVGSKTHPGQLRPQNEDNMLVGERVFVVADGMGGHEAGEVASKIAVDRIAELLAGDDLPVATDVVDAIATANGDIFRAAIANPEQHGMGTTVTAIAVIADSFAGRGVPNLDDGSDAMSVLEPGDDGPVPDGTAETRRGDVTPIVPAEPSEALVLANVGDSRTYLFRHGRLRRVTVDHSYVQELVATGHIDEEEARFHPRRNIVTRALGIEPDVRVDWWTLPLIKGDRFVLCSDGLVDEIADADITATLLAESDPQVAAERLVDQANEAGGRDNITVIVVDVLEGDDPPDPTQEIDVAPLWADAEADPTPAGPLELDADSAAMVGAGASDDDSTSKSKRGRRRLVRFAIAFAVTAALVAGFVVVSAWARSGYFVAFDADDQATIYQGRAGGVLWIEPTAENAGGPTRDELEPAVADEIDDEPRFGSFDEAAEFIRDGVTTTTTTTTTTSTTTTTTSTTTTTTTPPTTTTKP